MTATHTSGAAIQRYKIGYHSDDWGQRSSTPSGIPDASGSWVRYEDHVAALAAGQAVSPAELTPEQIEAMPVWRNFVGLWPESRQEIVRAVEEMIDNRPDPPAMDGGEDVARMDWIAVHGSFGVDSATGEVGGNGQKRLAATRKNIDAARAAQKEGDKT